VPISSRAAAAFAANTATVIGDMDPYDIPDGDNGNVIGLPRKGEVVEGWWGADHLVSGHRPAGARYLRSEELGGARRPWRIRAAATRIPASLNRSRSLLLMVTGQSSAIQVLP
jgi:hypothetical protein